MKADSPVERIMQREFASVRSDERLDFVDDVMALGRVRHMPVVDDGKLVGVVTDRDMYIALGTRDKRASQITVGDVATGTVWTCAPTDDVHVALSTMKERRVRRLPVVADGSLVGIISLNDLALVAGAGKPVQNEEIVDTFKTICAHRPMAAAVAA